MPDLSSSHSVKTRHTREQNPGLLSVLRILVETLTSAGFEVAVEQVSMSFGGHALPGKRELYLALMHPTLG